MIGRGAKPSRTWHASAALIFSIISKLGIFGTGVKKLAGYDAATAASAINGLYLLSQRNSSGSEGSSGSGGGKSESGESGSKFASNSRKMTPDEVEEFLGEGEGWHQTSAKRNYIDGFRKQLKGDKNVDFYIDRDTKEVFLKSNKSGHYVKTNQYLK